MAPGAGPDASRLQMPFCSDLLPETNLPRLSLEGAQASRRHFSKLTEAYKTPKPQLRGQASSVPRAVSLCDGNKEPRDRPLAEEGAEPQSLTC